MKKSSNRSFIMICLVMLFLAPSMMLSAQEAPALKVDEASICTEVVDRAPVNPGDNFKADVGRLSCFTKISGAENLVEVTHAWYFGDTERAKVTLPVKTINWRTYSSKIIQPHEIGKWRVDIISPTGDVLKTVDFEITQ